MDFLSIIYKIFEYIDKYIFIFSQFFIVFLIFKRSQFKSSKTKRILFYLFLSLISYLIYKNGEILYIKLSFFIISLIIGIYLTFHLFKIVEKSED
jgi:hypothetical protein